MVDKRYLSTKRLSFLFGANIAVETPGTIPNPAVKHSGAKCR